MSKSLSKITIAVAHSSTTIALGTITGSCRPFTSKISDFFGSKFTVFCAFEIEGVPFEVAKEALRLAAQKLPVTTKFIVRHDYDKKA